MTLIHTNQPARVVGYATANIIGTRFLALVAELRERKEITKALGKLSPQKMRDIGLIQNDVGSACSNRRRVARSSSSAPLSFGKQADVPAIDSQS